MVGAGYTLGPETGDYATVVKLFRVAMLAIVVVVVSALFKAERERAAASVSGEGRSAKQQPLVPWFLWLFIALVLVNSLGVVPPAVQQELRDVSRSCLVVAIAALGVKTSFRQLARAGWKPFLLLLVESVWMAGLVLAAVRMVPAQ